MNKMLKKITNKDLFAIVNIFLFLWMCYISYFDYFIHYRGYEYINEFFVYAILILMAILLAWRITRFISVSAQLLILLQIGIVINFAGGLIVLNDNRLYDNIFFGLRYDKYVHIINAFIGGILFWELYFKRLNLKLWIKNLQLIILVLGIGAVFEIIEYLVSLTIDINGVGNYDNNMQDLISNFIGAAASILFIRISSLIKDKRLND